MSGMPSLNANALTTLQNARLWLRRNNVVSVDDDDILTIIINSVSDAIIRHTGRQFFSETGVTKVFEYDGSGYLNIYPYELSSITSVTLNGTALVGTTGIGDGGYAAYPRNKTLEGTYLFLSLTSYYTFQNNNLRAPIVNVRDVTIVGNWGMASVPSAVEMACLEAVDMNYRNPDDAASRGTGEFAVTEIAPTSPGELFSDHVLALLDPFVRPVVG